MIENHVVSLEWAIKLNTINAVHKNLPESFFVWRKQFKGFTIEQRTEVFTDIGLLYPAYLATELLDVLPHELFSGTNYRLTIEKFWDKSCGVGYWNYFCDKSLPNALAQLLCWCHDNGYLDKGGV